MKYHVLIENHNYKHCVNTENCVWCEKSRTQNSITLLVQLHESRLEKNTQQLRLIFLSYNRVVKILTSLFKNIF